MNIEKTAIERLGWNCGSATIGTSSAPVGASWHVVKEIRVRADSGNSGNLLIGPYAGNEAFVIGPGETSPPLYAENVKDISIVGSASGQVYSWIAQ
jgi:hypothetical protein